MQIVTYDIVSNKSRVRVSKALEDYLERVQFSVFEGELNEKITKSVVAKLTKSINLDKDSIKIYFLCKDCEKKILSIGFEGIKSNLVEIRDSVIYQATFCCSSFNSALKAVLSKCNFS